MLSTWGKTRYSFVFSERSINLKWVNETFRKFWLESKWDTIFRVVPVEIFPAPPPFPRSKAHIFECLSLTRLISLLHESLEQVEKVQSSFLGQTVPSIKIRVQRIKLFSVIETDLVRVRVRVNSLLIPLSQCGWRLASPWLSLFFHPLLIALCRLNASLVILIFLL